jgi:hypothetical protein
MFSLPGGSPRKTFRFRLSRVATNRIFASRTDSIRRVIWWSGLGGLSSFKVWLVDSPYDTGLESLSRVKHSGRSVLLTHYVYFWFHSNSGYPNHLGSRHLTHHPSQRSLERYPARSCPTVEVKKMKPDEREDSS